MSNRDKPFPYNQDAEQSVLGAALQNEYAADEAVVMLNAKDFYNKIHEEIFSVIKELNKDGMPIDLITVSDALKRKGLLDLVGGPLYLSQLSRAMETNRRHKPILSDLRESGAIEQDADIVMFIYQDKDEEGNLEFETDIKKIDVAKHRNGETRGFEVIWLKQFTKFANYEKPKLTDK